MKLKADLKLMSISFLTLAALILFAGCKNPEVPVQTIYVIHNSVLVPHGTGLYNFDEDSWIDGDDGWKSDAAVFKIVNNGSVDLRIFGVSLSSGNIEDFDINIGSLPVTVEPSESTQFGIRFDPLLSMGNRSAVVAIESDDEAVGSYTFTVKGLVIGWRLPSSGVTPSGLFGCSVGISGNKAIVGSSYDDDYGNKSGSAYVFHWDGVTWVEKQKLTASDASASELFGHSVGICDNRTVVGAYWDDDNGTDSGSAYIFSWNGTNWVEQQKITASDGAAGDNFGYSVAIDGNRVVVGAEEDDDNGDNSGSAYIFYWNGSSWVEQQKIVAGDGSAYDAFGVSVDISGDRAIVGASGDDDSGDSSGSAYIFYWNSTNWIQEQKIIASNGVYHDDFGRSVAIEGDRVIVGAHGTDRTYNDAGSVYYFEWDGSEWTEEQEILASDPKYGDMMGYTVSFNSNRAVFSGHHTESNNRGHLFKWTGSNWVEQHTFLKPKGEPAIYGDIGILGVDDCAYIFDTTFFD